MTAYYQQVANSKEVASSPLGISCSWAEAFLHNDMQFYKVINLPLQYDVLAA